MAATRTLGEASASAWAWAWATAMAAFGTTSKAEQ